MADRKFSEFTPIAQPLKTFSIVGRDPALSLALQNIIMPLTNFPLLNVDNPTGGGSWGGVLQFAGMLRPPRWGRFE